MHMEMRRTVGSYFSRLRRVALQTGLVYNGVPTRLFESPQADDNVHPALNLSSSRSSLTHPPHSLFFIFLSSVLSYVYHSIPPSFPFAAQLLAHSLCPARSQLSKTIIGITRDGAHAQTSRDVKRARGYAKGRFIIPQPKEKDIELSSQVLSAIIPSALSLFLPIHRSMRNADSLKPVTNIFT